jgi:hypothetical protein
LYSQRNWPVTASIRAHCAIWFLALVIVLAASVEEGAWLVVGGANADALLAGEVPLADGTEARTRDAARRRT